METTNCSIENPEVLQKIESDRAIDNLDGIRDVPLHPEKCRETKNFVSMAEDTITVENMSTAIYLHQAKKQQASEEHSRRAHPRRNSAIASMLMQLQSPQENADIDSPKPRHRYQRRNSAVASMLFPSMIVRSLHDDQQLEPMKVLNSAQCLAQASPSDSLRLTEVPASYMKRRRSSVPWSQVYATSGSTTPLASPSPKKRKRAENQQLER